MKVPRISKRRPAERGVALIIALFTLLLISAMAAALIISSGTESALASNYRSSSSVYFAALSGVEEGRGRLLPSHPNYFNAFVAPPGTSLALGQVRYVLNPLPGETVDPTNLSSSTTYPDN